MVAVGGVSSQKRIAESFKIPREPVVWEQVIKNESLQGISGGSVKSFSVDEVERIVGKENSFEKFVTLSSQPKLLGSMPSSIVLLNY